MAFERGAYIHKEKGSKTETTSGQDISGSWIDGENHGKQREKGSTGLKTRTVLLFLNQLFWRKASGHF
jgi:hypothetical protein